MRHRRSPTDFQAIANLPPPLISISTGAAAPISTPPPTLSTPSGPPPSLVTPNSAPVHAIANAFSPRAASLSNVDRVRSVSSPQKPFTVKGATGASSSLSTDSVCPTETGALGFLDFIEDPVETKKSPPPSPRGKLPKSSSSSSLKKNSSGVAVFRAGAKKRTMTMNKINDRVKSMHAAIAAGNVQSVKKLLRKKTPCYGDSARSETLQTPLQTAAHEGNMEIVKLLLDRLPVMAINETDTESWTCLHYAANASYFGVCERILSHGIDVARQTDCGNTALHFLARKFQIRSETYASHIQLISLIVSRCPDIVNIQNKRGETPLHLACLGGTTECITYFMKFTQPDINLQTRDGETCLHYAIRSNRFEVVQNILDKGADVTVRGVHGNALELASLGSSYQIVQALKVAEKKRLDNNTPRARDLPSGARRGTVDALNLLSAQQSPRPRPPPLPPLPPPSNPPISLLPVDHTKPTCVQPPSPLTITDKRESNTFEMLDNRTKHLINTQGRERAMSVAIDDLQSVKEMPAARLRNTSRRGFSLSINQMAAAALQNLFGLSDLPTIISVYTCTWEQSSSSEFRGKLHVCANNVFFVVQNSKQDSGNVQIPFDQVLSVDKRTSSLIIKDSLQLSTAKRQYFFKSFLNRERAFDTIVSAWQNLIALQKKSSASSSSASPANKGDQQDMIRAPRPSKNAPVSSKDDTKNVTVKSASTSPRGDTKSPEPDQTPAYKELFCDDYGFPIEDVHCQESFKNTQSLLRKFSSKIEEKWKRYMAHLNRTSSQSPFSSSQLFDRLENDTKQLHALAQKGIPRNYRGLIWFVISGGYDKMRSSRPGYYAELQLYSTQSSKTTVQIDKDIARTFPNHQFFQNSTGRNGLKRLLVSYALRNPQLGYCQSMNFIAGLVLLVTGDEEQSFWIFTALVEDCLQDYFIRSMIGAQVDNSVFDQLVKSRLPKLHTHMTTIGFPLESLSLRWFMCVFTESGLPTETMLLIWDHVLLHRSTEAMLIVSVTILKQAEKELLKITDIFMFKTRLTQIIKQMFDYRNFARLYKEQKRKFSNKLDIGAMRIAMYNHLTRHRSERSSTDDNDTDTYEQIQRVIGVEPASFDVSFYRDLFTSVQSDPSDRISFDDFQKLYFQVCSTAQLSFGGRVIIENLKRFFSLMDLDNKKQITFKQLFVGLILFVFNDASGKTEIEDATLTNAPLQNSGGASATSSSSDATSALNSTTSNHDEKLLKMCWQIFGQDSAMSTTIAITRHDFCEMLCLFFQIYYQSEEYTEEIYEMYSSFSELSFDKFVEEMHKHDVISRALTRPPIDIDQD